MTKKMLGKAGHVGFGHGEGDAHRDTDQISSTTRYLSGAAYIDETYADQIIDEVVADGHRAIVPSIGYDLATVVRHCFRAQRLWLVQNCVVTALLLVGLFVSYQATLLIYALCFLISAGLPDPDGPHKRTSWKHVAVVLAVLAGLACVAGPLLSLLPGSDESGSSPTATPVGGFEQPGVSFWLCFAYLFIGIVITLAVSRSRMIRIITTELRRGAANQSTQPLAFDVERRLRVVAEAQHGNMLLHSGFEPFIGGGTRTNTWSVTTPLLLQEHLEPDAGGGRDRRTRRRQRVDIDPVELLAHVKQGLAGLRSPELPPQEQINGLQLRDQLISWGERWRGDPLIDIRGHRPYSYANREALDTIVRFPQTSARYFLRATVGAPDKAAVDGAGRAVLPGEHQGIISSTYLHVAVEGGMLYVEMVTTVLGPIKRRYLDIDRYGRSTPGDRDAEVFGEVTRRFPQVTAAAPRRALRGLLRSGSLTRSMRQADRETAGEATYDFGARKEARQLASSSGYATYLQRLDAEKYSRLIERRAADAIVTFLESKGVDASDYQATVNQHQYNTTTIVGDSYGPVATGSSSSATTNTTAAVPPAAPGGAGA